MSKCKTVQDEKKIAEMTIRKKVDGAIVKVAVKPSHEVSSDGTSPIATAAE